MKIKRIFFLITALVVTVVSFLIFKAKWNERYPDPPPNRGFFKTVESTLINPATVLDDIHNGKKLVLQIQPDPDPANPSFIMPISWSQNDFLEVAQAYGEVIWQDDLNLWHLYKLLLHRDCDSSDGKFTDAEFFYYQEVAKGENNLYSVRVIDLSPEYGYLTWAGDTFYPRPSFWGWTEIDMMNITKVPAEKALALADQRGGNEFRKTVNNTCDIGLIMWPADLKRMDWLVSYYGSSTSIRIWIPAK
jgi:hypothetical protein